MKKLLPLICFMAVVCAGARAQSVAFYQLADMVRLSSGQIDNILIKTDKFKLNNKEQVRGRMLNIYQSIDKTKKAVKGETLIVGNYDTNDNGDKLHIITYKSTRADYVTNLVKQIQSLGYKLSLRGQDVVCSRYVFDNALYHVVVTLMHDKSVNIIDIKEKDLAGT